MFKNRNYTLQKKLLMSFFAMILLLTVFIFICSSIITFLVLKERVSESFRFTLDHIANSVKIEKENVECLTNFIFTNDEIKNAIIASGENSEEAIDLDYQAYNSIKSYFISHNLLDICSISIMGNNGYYLYYYSTLDEQGFQYIPDSPEKIREFLQESGGKVMWGGIQPKQTINGDEVNEIPIYRQIKNFRYNETIGFMYLNLKPHLFSKFVQIYQASHPDFAKATSIYIVQDNSILANSETLDIERSIVLDALAREEAYSDEGYRVPDTKYYAYAKTIGDSNWNVIGFIPRSLMYVDNTYILIISVVSFFLVIIICSLVWLYISTSIFRPLQKLSNTVREIENGNKDLRAEVVFDDEIGTLGKNINRMLDRNEELYQTTLEEEMKLKEAQYQMLQAQINPHFLYNTLSSIRWMAIMIKANNIKAAVDAFWAISKYNFHTQQKYVSIEEELKIIQDYIYLQQITYKNIFEVTWDICPDVRKYRCIKFFLQPLVENSVKYGFLENNIRGMITISVQIDRDTIVFSITDNGKGMSEETIQEIESMQGSPSGISNVIHRLKLAYGERYSMTIMSEEGEFTEVVVKIPKEELEC